MLPGAKCIIVPCVTGKHTFGIIFSFRHGEFGKTRNIYLSPKNEFLLNSEFSIKLMLGSHCYMELSLWCWKPYGFRV